MKFKFFEKARKESLKSSHHKARVGSVIVRKSTEISKGYNKLKTHSRSTSPYKCLHSEMVSVISARQSLKGCTIYVYREDRNGNMAMAKPCQYCHFMLVEAGIKKVYYTTETGVKGMFL